MMRQQKYFFTINRRSKIKEFQQVDTEKSNDECFSDLIRGYMRAFNLNLPIKSGRISVVIEF